MKNTTSILVALCIMILGSCNKECNENRDYCDPINWTKDRSAQAKINGKEKNIVGRYKKLTNHLSFSFLQCNGAFDSEFGAVIDLPKEKFAINKKIILDTYISDSLPEATFMWNYGDLTYSVPNEPYYIHPDLAGKSWLKINKINADTTKIEGEFELHLRQLPYLNQNHEPEIVHLTDGKFSLKNIDR